jgi:hypothetical protein
MSKGKHYFIDETADNKFAVRAKGSDRAGGLFRSPAEAQEYAKKLNPHDEPDVERVWNERTGGRDQWRSMG